MTDYDIIVIGAGPGGYVCAIRAAQLGLKTACIEGRETLGGTCLNIGCIPSKALLHATHSLHEAQTHFEEMGIKIPTPKVDWAKMQAYKDNVIAQNTKGIEFLFKKNNVTWLKGWGKITSSNEVTLGDKNYTTKAIVIATGSEPAALKGVNIDEKKIVTSQGALSLDKIPAKMVVIGAGVIGLEMGSIYARLGTEIHFIEYMDEIAGTHDEDIQKTFQKILEKQGMKFILDAEVQSAKIEKNRPLITYAPKKGGADSHIDADVVLLSTGRKAFSDGLGITALGVDVDGTGRIKTDENRQTNIPGIYAIGDVTSGLMLAHKAEDEGMAVACTIAGKVGHVNYNVIPSVIYTTPEVASVGLGERALKSSGHDYKRGVFPLIGNGRAKAVFSTDGFVKILADSKNDRILGAHIIAPNAGELIHEICVAMEFGASAEDLALTCHAHPTISEAVREAALQCGDGAIHI